MITRVRGGITPKSQCVLAGVSQLRAGHERGARPVDPVDNDRVRDAPAVDRGNGLLLHMDVQDTDLAAPGRSGP
jgi:hypothetical protein